MNNYDISSYGRINSENKGTLTGYADSIESTEEQTIIKTLTFLECVLSDKNYRQNIADSTFDDYMEGISSLKNKRLSPTMNAYLYSLNTVLFIAKHPGSKNNIEAIVRAHDLGIAISNEESSSCRIIKITDTLLEFQKRGLTEESLMRAGPGFSIYTTYSNKTPNGEPLPPVRELKLSRDFSNNPMLIQRAKKALLKDIKSLDERIKAINNSPLENVINPDTSSDLQKELDEKWGKLNKIEDQMGQTRTYPQGSQRTEEEKRQENATMDARLTIVKQRLDAKRLKGNGARSPDRSQF